MSQFEPYDFTHNRSEDLKYFLLALATFVLYISGYVIIFSMVKLYLVGREGAAGLLMILAVYNTLFFLSLQQVYLLVIYLWKKGKSTVLLKILKIVAILFLLGSILFIEAYLTVHLVKLMIAGRWN